MAGLLVFIGKVGYLIKNIINKKAQDYMKKIHLLYLVIPVVAFVALGGAVYADTTTTNNGPMSSIVNAIATRFNLNVSDVQQVFDEQHAQMQAERQQKNQQRFTDRLSQAITDGKITQAQADQILANKDEIDALRQETGFGFGFAHGEGHGGKGFGMGMMPPSADNNSN